LRPRIDAEHRAASRPDAVGPAHGGLGLSLACVVAGIPIFYGKISQKDEPAPERLHLPVMWHEQVAEIVQVVRAWDGQTKFFHQRL
jgi:hypothetical protein